MAGEDYQVHSQKFVAVGKYLFVKLIAFEQTLPSVFFLRMQSRMEPDIQGEFKRLHERVLVLIREYLFIKLDRNSRRYTSFSLVSFDGAEKFLKSSAVFCTALK